MAFTVTCFVDWKKVRGFDFSNSEFKSMLDVYNKLRQETFFAATFDCFYVDGLDCDKIEMEFRSESEIGILDNSKAFGFLRQFMVDNGKKTLLKYLAIRKGLEAGD